MSNVRRTLAVKIQTPGGDNPLTVQLVGKGPFFRGIPVAGLALVGKGGTAPYAFSIIAGGDSHGGVNGLTLNTDGTLSGSGDEAGRFVFVAEVADSAGSVFPHSFSITFLPQLFVVAGLPTPGEIGLPYSYQFIVRDAAGVTLTSGYTVHAGNLPAGLSLTSAGLLHGTPTAPDGISYFTVRATDGADSIDIPCSVEVFTHVDLTMFQKFLFLVGTPTAYQIEATGGRAPYRFRYSDPTDPYLHGAQLNPNGTITGTALQQFAQSRDIVVVDSLGATDDAFVQLDFRNPNPQIQPKKNGVSVGDPGPSNFNFVEGRGIAVDLQNNGTTTTVEISAKWQPRVAITVEDGADPSSVPADYSSPLADWLSVPADGTISGWQIDCDVAGSAELTISRASRADYPTFTDLFTASISGDVEASATGLAYDLFEGDVVRCTLNALSGFTSLQMSMTVD